MSGLKRLNTLFFVLLMALAIPANAQLSDCKNARDLEELGLSIILAALPEIQHWGTQDGLGDLSLIGNWETPSGRFVTISASDSVLQFRVEYGHGFYDEYMHDTIQGDAISTPDGIALRRSTKAPSTPVEGDFLAAYLGRPDCEEYEPGHEPPDVEIFILSKKGSDLILSIVDKPGTKPVRLTIQRKDNWIQVADETGYTLRTLKQLPADAQPAPDAWKSLRDESLERLVTLMDRTLTYAQKNKGKCPPMKNGTQWIYTVSCNWLNQSGTNLPIKFNPALSGIKLASLKNTSGTVLYYTPKPWPDGTRCVAFTSGLTLGKKPYGCRIVSAAEWAKLAKANHLK